MYTCVCSPSWVELPSPGLPGPQRTAMALQAPSRHGPKYHDNRAQRLDQAARRQREWAAAERRARETGEEIVTPALAARKAERRRRQRAKAAARAAAAAEQQQQQLQSSSSGCDDRSRSDRRGSRSPLSLRSVSASRREPLVLVGPPTRDADGPWPDARPAPPWDPDAPNVVDGWDYRMGPRPLPHFPTPSPSEVTPEEAPSRSDHVSVVTPLSSESDLEVEVITSDNRRARWSEEPSDDRRDASDDRCDDEEENEGQEAPDDRREGYLRTFEIYVYSTDKDVRWPYCKSHDVRHFGRSHYFEVRQFRDPDADRELRAHDGRNPRIQQGLVGLHKYNFHVLAKQVAATVRDAIKRRRRGVALAFWCNHGKHRSVATAELMAAVFATKFHNVVIEHVALDYWRNRCRCQACSRKLPPQALQEAAAEAFDADWHVVSR